jgi:hypothetical protein
MPIPVSHKQPDDIDESEFGVEAENQVQHDDRPSDDERSFVPENGVFHNKKWSTKGTAKAVNRATV